MGMREGKPASTTRTERWLLTLVEGMPQMVWRAVGNGQWTWASPQWFRYTGLTPEESLGDAWLDAIHPEDRGLAVSAWRMADTLDEYQTELRVRAADGRYKWFRVCADPVHDGDNTIVEWLGTSTDVHDLRQLQAEQKVLVAELQHRTRNLIAVVHSIFMQTISSAASVDDFRNRFENRLAALSRVQGLLSTSQQNPITIRSLLDLELNALAEARVAEQVTLSGPDTIIRSATAQTLALGVHELSTNALKYGALSHCGGRLHIRWYEHAANDQQWLCLEWNETGAPIAPEAQHGTGYGRRLIEYALPRQLGARTRIRFGADHMTCFIDLPLRRGAGEVERG
ncbi:two-component system, chemotaxis family, CheB/CheR fusion protein [Sphingomonas gellani]|uniref:histidine kinase n=1 Tax=Sphingomonas gellani TaxID=1166340 RepID=A0A1H8HWT8_9SPHN|nr:HWE histidine kinase domain-containing protein [Sphingomonas gellani]SEN60860.1 two-component system, chemotaxis family, CheB/CheR fusion protein [Sphingomonas gellani]